MFPCAQPVEIAELSSMSVLFYTFTACLDVNIKNRLYDFQTKPTFEHFHPMDHHNYPFV